MLFVDKPEANEVPSAHKCELFKIWKFRTLSEQEQLLGMEELCASIRQRLAYSQ
jgi:hypothetical protein